MLAKQKIILISVPHTKLVSATLDDLRNEIDVGSVYLLVCFCLVYACMLYVSVNKISFTDKNKRISKLSGLLQLHLLLRLFSAYTR